jgi:hypothetical protein
MGTEKIYEFLRESGWTKKELALKCRLNPDSFYMALKYGKIGPVTADRLDFHTKGKIPYGSLTDKPRPAKAKRRKKRREMVEAPVEG